MDAFNYVLDEASIDRLFNRDLSQLSVSEFAEYFTDLVQRTIKSNPPFQLLKFYRKALQDKDGEERIFVDYKLMPRHAQQSLTMISKLRNVFS